MPDLWMLTAAVVLGIVSGLLFGYQLGRRRGVADFVTSIRDRTRPEWGRRVLEELGRHWQAQITYQDMPGMPLTPSEEITSPGGRKRK